MPILVIIMGEDGSEYPRPFQRECLLTGLKTRLADDEMDEVMPAAFPDGDHDDMARELSLGRTVESKTARYSFFPESRVPALEEDTQEAAVAWLQAMKDADMAFHYGMRAEDVRRGEEPLFLPEEAAVASAVMHEVIELVGADQFKQAEQQEQDNA